MIVTRCFYYAFTIPPCKTDYWLKHMIPVVDCNWHPIVMNGDSTVVHVLKCVYIQPKMNPSLAADDLEKVRAFALTPGSGGLPQGIVAWCDSSPQSIERLTNTSYVRGLNIGIDTVASLNDCLDAVKSKSQSLDLDVDATQTEQVVQALSRYPDVPVVLKFSKFGFKNVSSLNAPFQEVLEPFSPLDNVSVKITGLGGNTVSDSESASSNLIKDIVNAWGADRVMLASHSVGTDAGVSFDQLWLRYGQATQHLRARERESVLRSNAIRVYRL